MKLPRLVVFRKILSEIKGPIAGIIGLVIVGTFALDYVEPEFDVWEALYCLIVTLSAVGFGDVEVETREGRLVTSLVIVFGIIMVSLFASSIGNRVIQNMLNHDFRYEQVIKNYSDHIIVAGYGDIGRRIVEYLQG